MSFIARWFGPSVPSAALLQHRWQELDVEIDTLADEIREALDEKTQQLEILQSEVRWLSELAHKVASV